MGTYVRELGDLSFPEDKKAAFLADAAVVAREGGLFSRNLLQAFGKDIYLISFPDFADSSAREYDFCYSYYEDDCWENAGICNDPLYVYSEKIGWHQFNLAVQALYILAELYSDRPYVTSNDSRNRPDFAIQWLRYALKRELHYTWRKDIWNVLEMEAEKRSKCTPEPNLDMSFLYEFLGDEIDHASFMEAVSVLADSAKLRAPDDGKEGPQKDEDVPEVNEGTLQKGTDTQQMDVESSQKKEDGITFVKALNMLHDGIEAFKSKSTLSDEAQIRFLIKFLQGFDGSKQENKVLLEQYFDIIYSTVVLPAQASVKMIADAYGKNFWQLWWKVKGQIQKREIPLNPSGADEEQELFPYQELNTEEYFEISFDDRLYWWRKGGGVLLSSETRLWLTGLKERLIELSSQPIEGDIQTWQRRFVNLLASHPRVYCFEDLFFEFTGDMNSAMVRAAIILMEEVSKNTKQYRRLIAVLGNHELRKEMFQF